MRLMIGISEMEKRMILTVTLNPAIDKTYTAQSLILGNVNRMRDVINIAGGKGVNVTKILCQYGCEVTATGYLGGYTGRFIEEDIKRRGAVCDFVSLAGDTRCNINVLSDDGFVTEILEPGPVVTKEDEQAFLERYNMLLATCELVVLSGSVGRGMTGTIYKRLVSLAKGKKVPVFLDSSGESMKLGMEACPNLIKPNWKELEYLVSHKIESREEIIETAAKLYQTGIDTVVVSMGKKGLVSVSREGIFTARLSEASDVKVVNTVACGDSVVASYAMSFLQGESQEMAIRKACAISAANATTIESAQIPIKTAHALLSKVEVEQIMY